MTSASSSSMCGYPSLDATDASSELYARSAAWNRWQGRAGFPAEGAAAKAAGATPEEALRNMSIRSSEYRSPPARQRDGLVGVDRHEDGTGAGVDLLPIVAHAQGLCCDARLLQEVVGNGRPHDGPRVGVEGDFVPAPLSSLMTTL